MTTIRSTFSLDVADRIRAGASLFAALHDILGGIRDGSGPRTTDVLADLTDLGVIRIKRHSEPFSKRDPGFARRAERRNKQRNRDASFA